MSEHSEWWEAAEAPGAVGPSERSRREIPTCPYGHANPADAGFCGDCGSALAVAAPDPDPAAEALDDTTREVPALGAPATIGPMPKLPAPAPVPFGTDPPPLFSPEPVPNPTAPDPLFPAVPVPAPLSPPEPAPAPSFAAPATCPAGHATVPGAAFCGSCGAPLGGLGAGPGVPPIQPPPPPARSFAAPAGAPPQWIVPAAAPAPVPPGWAPAPAGFAARPATDRGPSVWRFALGLVGVLLLSSPFLTWVTAQALPFQGSSSLTLYGLWSQSSSAWADTSIKGDFTGVLVALVVAGLVALVVAAVSIRWRVAAWIALVVSVIASAVAIPLTIAAFTSGSIGVHPSGIGVDLAGVGLLAALAVSIVGVVRATVAPHRAREARFDPAPAPGGFAEGEHRW